MSSLVALVLLGAAGTPCGAVMEAVRAASFTCPADAGPSTAECATARLFYAKRANEPAWITCAGATAVSDRVLAALAGAARDGLRSGDYVVDDDRAPPTDAAELATRELRLTRAVLRYLGDLERGRVDPHTLRVNVHRSSATLLGALEAVASGEQAIGPVAAALSPQHPQLLALWSELRRGTLSSSVADVVALQLERWRGARTSSAALRVVVNVPAFRADVLADGAVAASMRVIVGRVDRPTPLLRTHILRVVLNPSWSVPRSIVLRDILPAVRRDPSYLDENHFKVWTSTGAPVRPADVDWASLSGMPYRFVQDPGPRNALGRVKLEMPNPHGVLLHDTSTPALFSRSRRAFSSGCVRLEHPEELALELLRRQGWTRARMEAVFARGTTSVVELARPVEVDLVYRTAEVPAPGRVLVHHDLYGLDQRLGAALDRVSSQRRGDPRGNVAPHVELRACDLES